ncbi:GspE/PulE family protein [Acidihalobacter prosperus]|uniref:GspE/PulE family protein n=1 Tax=Acidihalobacter prosperus TaxID=160660 RepID=UPI0007EE52C6|nr:ATPase, T2SS/T4P/T4SS family [Acidihalobacter prosperus]
MADDSLLTDAFEDAPEGWWRPKEQMPILQALRAVGMSDAHLRFARATAAAGCIPEPQAVREMRLLPAERIAAALALSSGYPWLPWTRVPEIEITGDLKDAVIERAGQHAVPVHRDMSGAVYYAIADPAHAREVRIADSRARFVLATPKTISGLYYRHYSNPREDFLAALEKKDWRAAMGHLLTESVYQGAGVENIYLEPGPMAGQVFIQVEGIRRHLHALPLERSPSGTLDGPFGRLITLIAGDIRAAEGDLSVPGSLSGLIPENLEGRFEFRVELKQTFFGRAAVLRPFDLQADVADIDLLGFDGETRRKLRQAIESPYGLLLVVGPTSSGKNTTAISLLYSTDPLARSIQTVEHPVEVRVASWEQHEIPVAKSNPEEIEGAARKITDSLLRSAPQIIYWGEIRNADALSRALVAANTGHMTLSTYHATDAASAILRMRTERTRAGDRIDMTAGGDLILGILSQRLLRKVCAHCAQPETRDEVLRVIERAGLPKTQIKRASKEGCPRCGDTGYAGRILAYEFFEPTADMDLGTASAAEIRKTTRPGLFRSGLERMAQGVTDYAEVMRVLKPKTGADE